MYFCRRLLAPIGDLLIRSVGIFLRSVFICESAIMLSINASTVYFNGFEIDTHEFADWGFEFDLIGRGALSFGFDLTDQRGRRRRTQRTPHPKRIIK